VAKLLVFPAAASIFVRSTSEDLIGSISVIIVVVDWWGGIGVFPVGFAVGDQEQVAHESSVEVRILKPRRAVTRFGPAIMVSGFDSRVFREKNKMYS
jgi:hypothetical protein